MADSALTGNQAQPFQGRGGFGSCDARQVESGKGTATCLGPAGGVGRALEALQHACGNAREERRRRHSMHSMERDDDSRGRTLTERNSSTLHSSRPVPHPTVGHPPTAARHSWFFRPVPAPVHAPGAPAAASICAPWQMAAMGFLASAKWRTISSTRGLRRRYSGARPLQHQAAHCSACSRGNGWNSWEADCGWEGAEMQGAGYVCIR